jgi:hypothetical protein
MKRRYSPAAVAMAKSKKAVKPTKVVKPRHVALATLLTSRS